MNPGETILGLDFANHLWVVLSEPAGGEIVLANFTSHNKNSCGAHCVVVTTAEYLDLEHDSCIHPRVMWNPIGPLRTAKANGTLIQRSPVPPGILARIQRAAHASRFTTERMRLAIEVTMARGDAL